MKRKNGIKNIIEKACSLLLTCIMTMGISTTAFAAGWIQNGGYWWYQNEDGSFVQNSSKFIDGRLYHFDGNGHRIASGYEQNYASDEALYRAFISQQFAGKENVRVALADLTHNGHEELIVVWYG